MAAFHNHQHHCQNPVHSSPITTTTTTTCACCCTCHYNSHPPPPPVQHMSIDPLLPSLVSLLQQQPLQQQKMPNPCYPHSHHEHHVQKDRTRRTHFLPRNMNFQQPSEEQDQETHFMLSSLLQRIDALESSLHYFSSSNKHFRGSFSLREAAAKVIQTHFRAFLVHRSRTLSQLQDLAFIKSSFNTLKSSILNKTHFNHGFVSHKAMDLLLKLDSIQGGDPMIRDGKKSISREVVRFIDFIDGLAGKRHGSVRKPGKNLRLIRNVNKSGPFSSYIVHEDFDLNRNQKEVVEKSSNRNEKIRRFPRVYDNVEEDMELEGFRQFFDDDDDIEDDKTSNIRNGILIKSNGTKPRVKKFVRFDEDGNVYRVFSDSQETMLNGDGSFCDGSDSSDDHGHDANGTQNYEIVLEEDPGTTQSSDGERHPVRNLRSGEYYEVNTAFQDQDGNIVFSAPVPEKMESRADLMKKKKAVKIVT